MKSKITETLNLLTPMLDNDEERADAARIQEMGTALEHETEKIFEDGDLSDTGKRKRYADLSRKTTTTLYVWRDGRFADIDKRTARVQRDVDAAANPRGAVPTDPTQALLTRLIDETRASEIRKQVLTIVGPDFDPVRLLTAYLGGDQETRKALETAPLLAVKNQSGGVSFKPWIPKEEIDRQHLEAAAATHPESVDALEKLQGSRMSVDRFAKMMLLQIAAITPAGQEVPTFIMDDGEIVAPNQPKETAGVAR